MQGGQEKTFSPESLHQRLEEGVSLLHVLREGGEQQEKLSNYPHPCRIMQERKLNESI